MGLIDINNPKKNVTGRGFAITGIVLGSLWSLVFVPMMLIALLLPAVGAAREAAHAHSARTTSSKSVWRS